jgi:enoyl-CoA hydratase
MVREFLTTPDLHEGIRAALVDKDRAPKWAPPTLDQVDPGVVDRFFTRFNG